MCGISGIINIKPEVSADNFLSASRSVHANRGPDYFDHWSNDTHLLTHSRLKIIDLSDKANQPMTSKSGNSTIVFNGEIYNYKTLAKSLNLSLQTESDTEVVLEAIEKWGIEQTLAKLNGMFAFCYVNSSSGQVILARDRFGQKPLYYLQQDSMLIFSSDIRVISQSFKGKLTIDYDTVDYYLSELSSPQPKTIWQEVKQLEPAHFIDFKSDTGELDIHPYWILTTQTQKTDPEQDILDQVEHQLNESILKRSQSDVPLGCFLSGGVDSGLVVSMLAQQSSTPVKTFTVGFDSDGFNELKDARLIAERYQTEHTELKIDLDIKHDIEQILGEFGEPFADSSAIPTYYISKEIRNHVTVALSGDGGDELFGGYLDYGQAYEADSFTRKYKHKLFREIGGHGSKISARFSNRFRNWGTALAYTKIPDALKLYRQMGFHPTEEDYFNLNRGYTVLQLHKIWQSNFSDDLTNHLALASLKTRLLNDYLVKVDRTSMANSLEVRSPFMDHELAQLAFSIPASVKHNNFQLKYLLKQLGKKHMYTDIFNRKKRGFEIPIKHWLKHELFDFAYNHIQDLINRQDFVNKSALGLLNQHKKGTFDHTHRIWALICLEIWLKQNID